LVAYGDVYLAVAPSPAFLARAREAGIAEVVDLRTADELPAATFLPLAIRAVGRAERPVLVRARDAGRAGAFWLAWRAAEYGLPEARALEEARRVGLAPAFEPAVVAWLHRRAADRRELRHRLTGSGGGPEAEGALAVDAAGDPIAEALRAALDDERKAHAYYLAVLERFGPTRPFSNLAPAEARHAGLVIDAMERRGIAVPVDRWSPAKIDVPPTLAGAVDRALRNEVENVAMYDRLLEAVEGDAEIEGVLRVLRQRSQERHIPALQRRAGSGPGDGAGGAGGGRGRGRGDRGPGAGRGVGRGLGGP